MGKELDMKTIGMSCNLNDPWQKQIHDYVDSKHNSSQYLKMTVYMEMTGSMQTQKPQVQERVVKVDYQSFV